MAGLAGKNPPLCLRTSTVTQHLREFMFSLSCPPSGTYLKQPWEMNASFFLETSSLVPLGVHIQASTLCLPCRETCSPLEQTQQDVNGLSPAASTLSPSFTSSAVHLVVSPSMSLWHKRRSALGLWKQPAAEHRAGHCCRDRHCLEL